jgi:hypothetical protein
MGAFAAGVRAVAADASTSCKSLTDASFSTTSAVMVDAAVKVALSLMSLLNLLCRT